MTGEDMVRVSQKDLNRLHIVRRAIEKAITQKQASEIVDLSERQVRRIAARIREEGNRGIVHRLRGRRSNRAIAEKLRRKILGLFKAQYHDFGPTLASEKLFEREKIKINDETLRLWLRAEGIAYQERKKRPHRQWRERKACFGQMVQMDGSHHAWLEDRGPWCVYMGYIDDATGRPFGRFYTHEGTIPAMDSLKRYIKRFGIPQSIYLDNHTAYKSPRKQSIEDELKNRIALSQFERAAQELGIEVIHADSPQAKGRIERLFRSFQDRLVKELRLENIKTIAAANEHLKVFLPNYAKKFAVEARRASDLHRPVPAGMDIDEILCIKTERALRNDFTVAHNRKLYQVLDNVRATKLLVEDRLDGSVVLRYNGRVLKYKEILTRPKKEYTEAKQSCKPKRMYEPVPMNHPWRTFQFSRRNNRNPRHDQKIVKEQKQLLTIP